MSLSIDVCLTFSVLCVFVKLAGQPCPDPSTTLTAAIPSFYVGAPYLNSDPHFCTRSFFPSQAISPALNSCNHKGRNLREYSTVERRLERRPTTQGCPLLTLFLTMSCQPLYHMCSTETGLSVLAFFDLNSTGDEAL